MLGGGVKSGVRWALPAHPHEWVPPFLFKTVVWSFRLSILHSKGFGGEAQTSTLPPTLPTPVHFFGLEILFCVIQSLIDSAWLLGLCFVVTHQHSTVKL